VDERFGDVFALGILFRGESHKSIVVEQDSHRLNYGQNQHVDSEVVLMPFVKCWLPNVLLNDVRILFQYHFWCFLYNSTVSAILKNCLITGFSLQVLVVGHCRSFDVLLYFVLEIFDSFSYEDTFALTAGIWLYDEHHWWVLVFCSFG
jgi:hypothetical protein